MQPTTAPQLVTALMADLIRTARELDRTTAALAAETARLAPSERRWAPWLEFAAGAACALALFAALH